MLKTGWILSLCILLCACFGTSDADKWHDNPGVDEVELQEKEAKKEMSLQLPAFPKDSDLLEFYVGPTQTQKFFIDEKSVSVGYGEVRYTLVARSSSGVKNISYEGIRCSTAETRRYALGSIDGKWVMSRNSEWKRINMAGGNRPQYGLARNYVCDDASIAGKAKDMIFRIRWDRPLKDRGKDTLGAGGE